MRIRMTRALLVLLGGLILSSCQGCHPTPSPNPPPGPVAVDASLDSPVAPTCAALCARGRALSCAWAAPTAQGHPCEEVCANATNGGPVTWDLGCRAKALVRGGCFAIDACP